MTADFDTGILKALLENASEAILITDTDVQVEFVNPTFAGASAGNTSLHKE
jgi:PAS domain-containing protein